MLAVVVLLILIMVIVVIVLKYRHYNSLKSREANTQGMILLLLCRRHSETVLYLHVYTHDMKAIKVIIVVIIQ